MTATKDTATTTSGMRRCIGSARFGIEAHEAPASDFPVQPSQKDGIGRMCQTHWKEYVSGLRRDQVARQGLDAKIGETSTERAKRTRIGAPDVPTATYTQNIEAAERRRAKAGKPAKPANPARLEAIRAARAIVAASDALRAEDHVRAVATDTVQDALALVAAASLGTEHAAPEQAEA